MKYSGITWGPSMRGYLSDNKERIARVEQSLAALKNQDGQFAREHRMLLEVFRDIDAVLTKHIELAYKQTEDLLDAMRGKSDHRLSDDEIDSFHS